MNLDMRHHMCHHMRRHMCHHKPVWLSGFRAHGAKGAQKCTQIPYTRIRAYTCTGLGAYIHVYMYFLLFYFLLYLMSFCATSL